MKTGTLIFSLCATITPLDCYSASAEKNRTHYESGITASYLSANDNRIKNEFFTSADLTVSIPQGKGNWSIYIEGNSSPRTQGVSSLVAESSGDAGSALDRNNKGRLQISELHYTLPIGKGNLTAGLIDTRAMIDGSDYANDQTTQFLGTSFVNNPSIEFPDYTLGLAWFYSNGENRPGYTFILSSSHGLADNATRSYSDLVKAGDTGKGIFSAFEAIWPIKNNTLRTGIWVNSADQVMLNGAPGSQSNYGLHVSADIKHHHTGLNLRAGLANKKVAQASRFLGMGLQHTFEKFTAGFGLARTWLSSDVTTAGMDDTTQIEVYGRFPLSKQLEISPVLQLIKNTGFDSSNAAVNNRLTLFGIRLQYSFSS